MQQNNNYNNNTDKETQKPSGKVININPEQVGKAAAVGVGAAAAGYLIWKGIEFLSSLPVCGGCAVLSPF